MLLLGIYKVIISRHRYLTTKLYMLTLLIRPKI